MWYGLVRDDQVELVCVCAEGFQGVHVGDNFIAQVLQLSSIKSLENH
jgi:hypothetical protein